MLRVVTKQFEADNGVQLKPGDIVDDTLWRNARKLYENGYTGETDATKVTVDPSQKKQKSTKAPATVKTDRPLRKKRSALVRQPRVFS